MARELKVWEKRQKRDHFEKYNALAEKLGISALTRLVLARVASRDRILEAHKLDEHLNTIQLKNWDLLDGNVWALAKAAGIKAWSLCETTCVLKVVARHHIAGIEAPPQEWRHLFETGDAVKVAISDTSKWATGVAERLQGVEGTLECFKADHGIPAAPAWLVNFDEPVVIREGEPAKTGFWFSPEELRGY